MSGKITIGSKTISKPFIPFYSGVHADKKVLSISLPQFKTFQELTTMLTGFGYPTTGWAPTIHGEKVLIEAVEQTITGIYMDANFIIVRTDKHNSDLQTGEYVSAPTTSGIGYPIPHDNKIYRQIRYDNAGGQVEIAGMGGKVLTFGPQLLATWDRQDANRWSANGYATFYPVSAGQHNGWPNRFDSGRKVNGYSGYGFYNIGDSGSEFGKNDGNLTMFGDLSNNPDIFYRVTFTEADDWLRNAGGATMENSWELQAGHYTNTIFDFRRVGTQVQYRTSPTNPWIAFSNAGWGPYMASYSGINWFIYTPDPTRIRLTKSGGTAQGSMISPSKVEVYSGAEL